MKVIGNQNSFVNSLQNTYVPQKKGFYFYKNKFKCNYTLNKKLNLPAGSIKCLYESFIHSIRSNGWFIQELKG